MAGSAQCKDIHMHKWKRVYVYVSVSKRVWKRIFFAAFPICMELIIKACHIARKNIIYNKALAWLNLAWSTCCKLILAAARKATTNNNNNGYSTALRCVYSQVTYTPGCVRAHTNQYQKRCTALWRTTLIGRWHQAVILHYKYTLIPTPLGFKVKQYGSSIYRECSSMALKRFSQLHS